MALRLVFFFSPFRFLRRRAQSFSLRFHVIQSLKNNAMAKVLLRGSLLLNRRLYYSYAPEPFQPLPRSPVRLTADEAVRVVKSGEFFLIIFNFQ